MQESPVELGLKVKVIRDDQLIVPGFGAEQVLLGKDFSEITKQFKKDNYKIVQPPTKNNLLKHVFKTSIFNNIYFDRMYFFEKRGFVVLTQNQKVVALLSMNVQRVTIDSVDLHLGIKNFLDAYQKYNFKKNKLGNNTIYNSNRLGMGVVDDGNDNLLDMYYIFLKHD